MGLWLSLQLAHRAVAPGAGRPRAAADDRRAVARPERPRPPAGRALPLPQQFADAAARLDAAAAALPRARSPCPPPPPTNGRWTAQHSATGAPLLAGDPHLAFGFPASGTWRASTRPDLTGRRHRPGRAVPGARATTATSPGPSPPPAPTPQDLFIETPVGTDEYQTPDGPQALRHPRRKCIKVRGQPDEVLTVRGDPARPGDQRPAGAAAARSWRSPWPTSRPATPPRPGCSR